jgi:hypothetical protein
MDFLITIKKPNTLNAIEVSLLRTEHPPKKLGFHIDIIHSHFKEVTDKFYPHMGKKMCYWTYPQNFSGRHNGIISTYFQIIQHNISIEST